MQVLFTLRGNEPEVKSLVSHYLTTLQTASTWRKLAVASHAEGNKTAYEYEVAEARACLSKVYDIRQQLRQAHVYRMDSLTNDPQLTLDYIRVLWSESSYFTDNQRFDSFEDFDVAIMKAARAYDPTDLAYDKTKVEVYFVETPHPYVGRIDINSQHILFDMRKRMIRYVESFLDHPFYAGDTEELELYLERLRTLLP